jgi:hypothetical protein
VLHPDRIQSSALLATTQVQNCLYYRWGVELKHQRGSHLLHPLLGVDCYLHLHLHLHHCSHRRHRPSLEPCQALGPDWDSFRSQARQSVVPGLQPQQQ